MDIPAALQGIEFNQGRFAVFFPLDKQVFRAEPDFNTRSN
jgi:hypothetical protein